MVTKPCAECSKPIPSKRHIKTDYCSNACRSAFHNRRTQRGALVYDVLMLQLTRPDLVTEYDLRQRLDIQMGAWLEEDAKASRRSSAKASEVRYRLPIISLDLF